MSNQTDVQGHEGAGDETQCGTGDRALRQGRMPMRDFLAPHSIQVEWVAGRPFFMVMASTSQDVVLAWHVTQ